MKNGGELAKAEEQLIEETTAELAQTLAAEEAATEERLRKKVAATKKKKATSWTSTDPNEDIYLAVFHASASFEILGDPA